MRIGYLSLKACFCDFARMSRPTWGQISSPYMRHAEHLVGLLGHTGGRISLLRMHLFAFGRQCARSARGLDFSALHKHGARITGAKRKNAEALREGSSFRLSFAVDKEEREERGGLQRDSFHCPG